MSYGTPRDMKAREYAAERGATIMIYPVISQHLVEGSVEKVLIKGLKEIFGAWRWPSMG